MQQVERVTMDNTTALNVMIKNQERRREEKKMAKATKMVKSGKRRREGKWDSIIERLDGQGKKLQEMQKMMQTIFQHFQQGPGLSGQQFEPSSTPSTGEGTPASDQIEKPEVKFSTVSPLVTDNQDVPEISGPILPKVQEKSNEPQAMSRPTVHVPVKLIKLDGTASENESQKVTEKPGPSTKTPHENPTSQEPSQSTEQQEGHSASRPVRKAAVPKAVPKKPEKLEPKKPQATAKAENSTGPNLSAIKPLPRACKAVTEPRNQEALEKLGPSPMKLQAKPKTPSPVNETIKPLARACKTVPDHDPTSSPISSPASHSTDKKAVKHKDLYQAHGAAKRPPLSQPCPGPSTAFYGSPNPAIERINKEIAENKSSSSLKRPANLFRAAKNVIKAPAPESDPSPQVYYSRLRLKDAPEGPAAKRSRCSRSKSQSIAERTRARTKTPVAKRK
ncbi:hypothetical protein L596_012720 [Steinernema carpocapsae]|uniref:Uncharacterized protein n=1 Tax=Steinernema carpocapsae TaxID=34508 RepID=A0A4U5NXY9_STECR|nr:hypothetical protein L596_012720 [Steinernema carpocapsae]